ncbi:MAG: acyltransferase family protein [Vulcanimicrobiaceae bacterium]
MKASSKAHVGVIDGLRGLAIIMVILYHIFERTGFAFSLAPLGIPFDFHTLPRAGFLGVEIFFFISGFCIFYPYAGAIAGTRPMQSLNHYASRRFWKIVPSYYVALFFLAFVYPFNAQPGIPLWQDLLLHATFLHSLSQASFISINGNFWSLADEVQFYVLFPAILWFALRSPWLAFVTTAAVGVFANIYNSFTYHDGLFTPVYALPANLALFAFGMATAYIVVRLREIELSDDAKRAATGVSILAACSLMLLFENLNRTGGGPVAWSWQNAHRFVFGASLMTLSLGAIFGIPWWRNAIANRVLVFYADISYTTYLWNAAILTFLAANAKIIWGYPWSGWLFAAIGIGSCTLVGYLTTHLIERPLLRNGERIATTTWAFIAKKFAKS